MHDRAMTAAFVLDDRQRAFLDDSRRATLATTAADGRARLVPICFVVLADASGFVVYSPIDEKPKTTADPRSLARVRDVLARPHATILVDRWSEDWSALAWLRLEVTASVLEPGSTMASDERAAAIGALREKYRQYADQRLEEALLLRLTVTRAVGWEADVTDRGTAPQRAAGGSGSSSSPGDSRRR
jgi:PPOX class probable F420-dependent enzyme